MAFKTYSVAIALQIFSMLPAVAFEVPADGLVRQNRALFGVTLSDLLISDKIRTHKSFLCTDDGQLMVMGFAYPVEKSEYSPEVIVEIISGKQVTVTIGLEHMSKPNKSDAYVFLTPCDRWSTTEVRLPVQSVNGFTTLDAYLNSDFVTKLPAPNP